MKKLWVLIGCVIMLAVAGRVDASLSVLNFEDLYPGYESYGTFTSPYNGFTMGVDATWTTKYYEFKYNSHYTRYTNGTIGNVSMFTGYANPVSISMPSGSFTFYGAYITSA